MRYEVKFEGVDYGTAAYTKTEFACEASFLDRVDTNDVITNFDGFVEDVGEEISAQVWFDWENLLCAVDSDESELTEEDLEDEEGYYVYDDGDVRARIYHGWGMSDTIALTVGAVIANAMRDQLREYWLGAVDCAA